MFSFQGKRLQFEFFHATRGIPWTKRQKIWDLMIREGVAESVVEERDKLPKLVKTFRKSILKEYGKAKMDYAFVHNRTGQVVICRT
jgi:uncharacterized protein YjaZ